jgi:hypothetical protein
MRLLVIALFCLPFLYSCEPTTPEPPTPNNVVIGPQPKFQYKANGALIIADAVYDARVGYISYPAMIKYNGSNSYEFGSSNGETTGSLTNSLIFGIPANVITQTTYSITGSDSKIGGLSYYSANVTMTITRVSNGYADGTFNGTLSRTNPGSTVTLTEGKFSNVPIINY